MNKYSQVCTDWDTKTGEYEIYALQNLCELKAMLTLCLDRVTKELKDDNYSHLILNSYESHSLKKPKRKVEGIAYSQTR